MQESRQSGVVIIIKDAISAMNSPVNALLIRSCIIAAFPFFRRVRSAWLVRIDDPALHTGRVRLRPIQCTAA